MKNYYSMSESELIDEINNLFHPIINGKNVEKTVCHSFVIYNHQGYWGFKVINSWYKWFSKNLEYDFGCYKELRNALLAFLIYIKTNKINIKKLMEIN